MALCVVIRVTLHHATIKREIDGGGPVPLSLYAVGLLAFPSSFVTSALKGTVPVCFSHLLGARRLLVIILTGNQQLVPTGFSVSTRQLKVIFSSFCELQKFLRSAFPPHRGIIALPLIGLKQRGGGSHVTLDQSGGSAVLPPCGRSSAVPKQECTSTPYPVDEYWFTVGARKALADGSSGGIYPPSCHRSMSNLPCYR